MTPSDELWIDMAHFDTDLADGIWDGTAAPADPPPWYGEVATLIRAAKAPARPDELAGEEQIVALMRQAILESASSDSVEPSPLAGTDPFRPVDLGANPGAAGLAAMADSEPDAGGAPELTVIAGAPADAGSVAEDLAGSPVLGPAADGSDLTAVAGTSADLESVAGDLADGPVLGAAADGAPELTAIAGVPADAEPAADVRAGAGADGDAERRRPRHLRAVDAPASSDEDDEGRPLHLRAGRGRTGRVVRRLVAVKAVAATTAVAIGITAAAATTGIGIVTVVVPAARDRLMTDDKPSGEVIEDDGSSDGSESDSGDGEGGTRACARDADACTSASGTRVDPETGEPLDPATEAGATPGAGTDDGTSTETTIAGEDSTGETPGESPSTSVADPGTGEPTDPVTTDTTVGTTIPEETTTTTTTTEPPTVEPKADPSDERAAAGAAGAGAGTVETLAADTGAPAGPSVTQG